MSEDKKAVKKTKAAPARDTTAVRKEDAEPGFFGKIGRWFREMKSELKKVIWPTPKELEKNTLVSLFAIVVSACGIGIFDWLATLLVKGILSLVAG